MWMGVGEAGTRLPRGSNRELKPMSLKKEGSRTKSKMLSHRCMAGTEERQDRERWGFSGDKCMQVEGAFYTCPLPLLWARRNLLQEAI